MKGHVVATDGERVRVAVDRPASCAGCGQLRSCGLDGGYEHAVNIPASAGLEPGVAVDVEISPACGLRYALWAYGLPLLAWVGGVIAGVALGPRIGIPRDPAGLACGGISLAAALVVLHRADAGFRRQLDRDVAVSVGAGTVAGTRGEGRDAKDAS